jgi:hypothetical protein
MATKRGIITAFALLGQGGVHQPQAIRDEPEATVSMWHTLLADLSDEDLTAAVMRYLRAPDSQFWPTPGKLLDLAPSRQKAIAANDADSEWGYLLECVRRKGWPNPPGERWQLAEDPLRKEALEAGLRSVGGWAALCALETDQMAAARAAFRTAYRAIVERREQDGQTGQVLALIEGGRKRLPGGAG